jgi:hypothetical protein
MYVFHNDKQAVFIAGRLIKMVKVTKPFHLRGYKNQKINEIQPEQAEFRPESATSDYHIFLKKCIFVFQADLGKRCFNGILICCRCLFNRFSLILITNY